MTRFQRCNCPAGMNAEGARHAPDCPSYTGMTAPMAAMLSVSDGLAKPMNNPTEREKFEACPFCKNPTDFLVERLDLSSSVVICQGMIDEHSACLARGPVGGQDDDGEDQPGRDAAIREWNKRAALEQDCGEVVRYWHKPKIGFAVLEPKYYGDESGYIAYEDYAALNTKLAAVEAERDRYAVLLGNSERENLDLSGQLSAAVIRSGDLSKKGLAVMDAGDTLVAERDALKVELENIKSQPEPMQFDGQVLRDKHGVYLAEFLAYEQSFIDKLLASKGD